MKILLIRHFKVKYSFSFFSTSRNFDQAMFQYDQADVKTQNIDPGFKQYQKCFCSGLKRSIKTAEFLFGGEPVKTTLINEVPLVSSFKTRIVIPTVIWLLIGRVLWFFNSAKQPEGKGETVQRAVDFYNKYCQPDKGKELNIMVVTHGFFMRVLARILKREGFQGKPLFWVKHATPFLFEYPN